MSEEIANEKLDTEYHVLGIKANKPSRLLQIAVQDGSKQFLTVDWNTANGIVYYLNEIKYDGVVWKAVEADSLAAYASGF